MKKLLLAIPLLSSTLAQNPVFFNSGTNQVPTTTRFSSSTSRTTSSGGTGNTQNGQTTQTFQNTGSGTAQDIIDDILSRTGQSSGLVGNTGSTTQSSSSSSQNGGTTVTRTVTTTSSTNGNNNGGSQFSFNNQGSGSTLTLN